MEIKKGQLSASTYVSIYSSSCLCYSFVVIVCRKWSCWFFLNKTNISCWFIFTANGKPNFLKTYISTLCATTMALEWFNAVLNWWKTYKSNRIEWETKSQYCIFNITFTQCRHFLRLPAKTANGVANLIVFLLLVFD